MQKYYNRTKEKQNALYCYANTNKSRQSIQEQIAAETYGKRALSFLNHFTDTMRRIDPCDQPGMKRTSYKYVFTIALKQRLLQCT